MMLVPYVLIAGLLTAASDPVPVPVETCGTDVPKVEAELRAVACPSGFVGQWYQTRDSNSCVWAPTQPQWFACSEVIIPPDDDHPPMD